MMTMVPDFSGLPPNSRLSAAIPHSIMNRRADPEQFVGSGAPSDFPFGQQKALQRSRIKFHERIAERINDRFVTRKQREHYVCNRVLAVPQPACFLIQHHRSHTVGIELALGDNPGDEYLQLAGLLFGTLRELKVYDAYH